MKKRGIFKVEMTCSKCRTKALQIAAEEDGVDSVGFEGQDKDKVVVAGNRVNFVHLAKCLRKKVGHTDILNIADVKQQ